MIVRPRIAALSTAVVIAIGFVTVAFAYFYLHAHETAFVQNAMGNFFATALGVIIGVPLALWIEEVMRGIDARRRQEEAKQRRRLVLEVIMRELEHNAKTIRDAINNERREIALPGLKDELWRGLSTGGELERIDDPILLEKLSDAYHYVSALVVLERQWLHIAYYPGMTGPPKLLAELKAHMRNVESVALKGVDKALAAIQKNQ